MQNCVAQSLSAKVGAVPFLHRNRDVERWVDRLLPYFSIGINVMLCASFIEPSTVEKTVYGRFASAILHLFDLPL